MKRDWLFQNMLLSGRLFLLTTAPALIEKTRKIEVQGNPASSTSLSHEQVNMAQDLP